MDQDPELPPDLSALRQEFPKKTPEPPPAQSQQESQPPPPPLSPPPSLPPVIGAPPPQEPYHDSMRNGFGIGALWTVVALVAFGLTAAVGIGIIGLAIGIVQLAWIIPLTRKHKKAGHPETVKGLWLAAGITFLLNAGCWGALIIGFSGTNFH